MTMGLNLSGFKLTFDDEFNTRSISQVAGATTWGDIRSQWRFDADSDIGFGHSSFVDPASGYDPFSVSGGALTITAVPDRTSAGYPGSWESGLITTQGKFSQTYGYFEIRADFSNLPGAWDGFWLLPDHPLPDPQDAGGWQELDVVEHYGGWDKGVYSTIHTTDPQNGVPWQQNRQVYSELINPSGFHTYGMDWEADKISFYVDGELIGSQATPSDMHGPMYLLANLATQASENNNADAAGVPISSSIDYIRVYSKDPSAIPVPLGTVSAPDGRDPGVYGATTANVPATQGWVPSPIGLQDFGLGQGWGSVSAPRQLADMDLTGSADYLGFGAEDTVVADGITGADGSGNMGPGFTAPAAVIHDFGTNEGYTAQAQRGAANTGYGVAASIYGQGFAGIYWYGASARSAHTDAAGKTYYTLTYDSTPHFYANFGTQQGWTPHNGFQVLKTSRADTYASILGFGNDGIVVGGQAFAPGADASQVTVLPASIGNNAGWDQLTDVRTFLDSDGGIVDLNHDGVADFIGMGPQGTVFAYGQEDPSSHQYTLGPVQTATFGGGSTDLGRAQGWTDQNTQRLIVHDAVTGYDDILAFGAAGVFVAEGQDPASHGGQPFGALHLAIADFGSNQGWSNAQTPRLVGDVNGDGTPDIVGFGASSTFVALGSRDASGHLSFTMDPTKQINDFGYQEGWDSATTVRALADVDGSGHQSLVLSGYAGTQAWHLA
ncbi:glycoside hydrolase family 16 protein [Methylobacterium sp. JK268]